MEKASEPARLAVEGAVATVSLDRPDQLNPIDVETAACLLRLGREVAAREDVTVLVLEGRGKAFCAGGDVSLFAAHIDDPGVVIRGILEHLHPFLILLRTMPKVVVTKLHGAVAGAGLSLAFMGDLAVASAETRFVPGYGKLGVSPDGGGTIGLVARAGPSRALQIYLAEDGFGTTEALAWGLLNEVAPRERLDARVAEIAARLARNAPAALAGTKRLIMRDTEAELRARLDAEERSLLACAGTEAFRDAVRRFAAASAARRS